MKRLISIFLILQLFLIPDVWAGGTGNDADTVVITLENNSKIVIYTKNKTDLKEIEKYDINKMIRDLNNSISKTGSNYLELKDNNGSDYMTDTTIVYQEGDNKASIKLGSMELSLDDEVNDWEDIEDKWERSDDFKSYSYIDRKVDRTKNYFNVELGTNNWLLNGTDFPNEDNLPYSVRPWGSWYVGLASINKTWIGGPLFVDWGFGISFYNWKLEDDNFQAIKGPEMIEFVEVAPEINAEKSKLAATYVNFSLVPMFDFARGRKKVNAYERGPFKFTKSNQQGLRFGGGGYVGYRLGSRSKLVYKDGGDKEKDIMKDNFYLTNLRYGVRAQLGYKGVDFFANYDLNEVFATGRGPKLNAISFGIIF